MTHVEIYRHFRIFFPGDDSHLIAKPATWAGGKWHWRFVKNGRTMADSGQGYSRRIDCINGCASVLGAWTFLDWRGLTVIERMNRRGEYDHIPVIDLTREAAS